MEPRIAILDYGGQYVQNIRRSFREMGIEAEIVPHSSTLEDVSGCAGLVLSGGPYSVYQPGAPSVDRRLLTSGKPVLGLCYGHQLIAHSLGGRVSGGKSGEYGFAEIDLVDDDRLFRGIDSPQICWMSHGDEVTQLPKDFSSKASTPSCPNAAMAHDEEPIFGLQFHPEVSHTPEGWRMLANFASEVCGLEVGTWDPRAYIRAKAEDLRREVGEGRAMVAVSGGVDSTVAAVLARSALGERLLSVHVDHGFMRRGESAAVVRELSSLGLEPMLIDASEEFMDAMKGLEEGDAKRKAVGELFIRIFERVAGEHGVTALIQGTIAPDAIESSRGMASEGKGAEHGGMIKLHHNVGGLPGEMWIRVVEPIRELFKYQVRMLGSAMGIPDPLLNRQPFPGPGLSVRAPGAVDPARMELLREATAITEMALEPHGPAQYLVYLTDRGCARNGRAETICRRILGDSYDVMARTHGTVAVGVKGDERHLGRVLSVMLMKHGRPAWHELEWLDILRLQSALTGHLRDVCRVVALVADGKGKTGAVIRAVDTRDFMTAMPTQVPFEVLYELGKGLTAIPGIGRAFYEVTTKPSSTVELE